MIKEDCMHYKNNECDCLNEVYCEYERCNFYKTKKEDDKIKAKCRKRLKRMGWI